MLDLSYLYGRRIRYKAEHSMLDGILVGAYLSSDGQPNAVIRDEGGMLIFVRVQDIRIGLDGETPA